jgi:tetratricopeptide (TPR) repeat protein
MTGKIMKYSKIKNGNVLHYSFILAFCLMLLPFDLLSFINGSASANSDNMVEYNLKQQDQKSPVVSPDDIQKSLWRSNITPAQEQKEKAQKEELKSLIEQINAMNLSVSEQAGESPDVNEFQTSNEPEKNISQAVSDVQKVKNTNDNNTLYKPITEKTIQKLKKMAENPQKIDNPYEIGNTLYLSNCVGEAAAFYKEALRRNKPEDISSSEDRAWLLFQTANSLQSVNKSAADDIYKKLVTEFPDSPWAGIARVQSNLITWYIKDQPDELLKEYQR